MKYNKIYILLKNYNGYLLASEKQIKYTII